MPPKRRRFSFLLRPESPAELAGAIASLTSIMDGALSIDLTDEGLAAQALGACQVDMARLFVPASSFVEYELEAPLNMLIPCERLKGALKGKTKAFVIYQLANDEDHVIVEKTDSGTKWTLALLDAKEFESFPVPRVDVRASHSYGSGPEMVKALSELKSAMAADDGADGSVRFAATTAPRWVANCGSKNSSTSFAQLLRVGTSEAKEARTLTISGRYFASFLQVAAAVKGPASLKMAKVPGRETLFEMSLESTPGLGRFEVDLFLAPKMIDDDE